MVFVCLRVSAPANIAGLLAMCRHVPTKANYRHEIKNNRCECLRDFFSQATQVHGQPGGMNEIVKKSAVCAQLLRVSQTAVSVVGYSERPRNAL